MDITTFYRVTSATGAAVSDGVKSRSTPPQASARFFIKTFLTFLWHSTLEPAQIITQANKCSPYIVQSRWFLSEAKQQHDEVR